MYTPENPDIFKLFLEQTHLAVAMVDRQMRYLLASRHWLSKCAGQEESIVGQSFYDVFPEFVVKNKNLDDTGVKDREKWQKIQSSCLAGTIERWREEYPEAELVVQWQAHLWNANDGEIGGLILWAEEITDRSLTNINVNATTLVEQECNNEKELRKQNQVLVELAKSKTQNGSDLKASLQEITEATAHTLEVDRVSIWLFSDCKFADLYLGLENQKSLSNISANLGKNHPEATNQKNLLCIELYESKINRHSSGLQISADNCNNYLQALAEERLIAVNNLKEEVKIQDFAVSYLTPQKIKAVVTVPIRIDGEMIGFLCCENSANIRQWLLGEKNFAAAIGDYTALALENADRAKAKAQLEDTLDQLQAVLDAVPGCISWFSSDLVYLGVNGYLAQTFKTSPDNFIGKKIGFLSGSPKFNDLVPQFFDNPAIEDRHQIEVQLAGTTKHFLVVAHKYLQGKAAVFVGFDITDRVSAEAALKQINEELEIRVEERTHDLKNAIENLEDEIAHRERVEEVLQFTQFAVNQAADAIFWVTPDGQFFYVNDAACLSLGYSTSELVSLTIHDINPDFPPEVWPEYWEEIKEFGSVRLESRHCAKDGKTFPVEITVSYLRFKNKEYNCIFARDITDRKQAEAELYEAKAAAEAANKAKSAFLANISYEMRTPLNAIIGYSELLQDEAKEQGIKDENFLADLLSINTSGQDLLYVLNDILDLSIIELNQMELFSQRFDVVELIEEIKGKIQPVITFNNNNIIVQYVGNLGIMYGDRLKIEQILMNLLTYSSKFMRSGTITINISRQNQPDFRVLNPQSRSISVTPLQSAKQSENMEDWLCFIITDTGMGMTKEHLETIFQPFPDADSPAMQYGGAGLGVALARNLCQMMGGDIIAESQIHQGTSFTVYIPAFVSDRSV